MRIYAYKTVESVEVYGCDIDEKLVDQINNELKQVWVKEENIIDCPVFTIEDIEDVWRTHCEFTAMSSAFTDVEVTLHKRWNLETYETSMYKYLLDFLLDVLDDSWIDTKWSETLDTTDVYEG